MKKRIGILLCIGLMCGCTAASEAVQGTEPGVTTSAADQIQFPEETAEPTAEAEEPAELTLSSDDLNDGVWNSIIADEGSGQNLSPDLEWNGIPGAGEYALFMIDPDGNNWIHWYKTGITGTSLEQGASGSDEYIGPYPPGGTHTYSIHLYALKKHFDADGPCSFNGGGNDMDAIVRAWDTADGQPGNIIGSAVLSGTYTAGN